MPSVEKRVRRAARMLPWLALCLAGCATSTGRRVSPDPELNRRAEEAHQVLRQAGPARAAVLYVELADLARRRGDDQAFSALSYNLAACRIESGDPEGALASLRESRDAALRIGSPTDEILALEARVRHAMGQTEQASELLEEALREARSRRQPDLLASLELQQAEFELDRGRPDEAKAALGAAKNRLRSRSPALLHARVEGLKGRMAEGDMDFAAAGAAWETQARWLAASGFPHTIPETLERAAGAYFRAGLAEDAAICYWRAARTWAARGYEARAREAWARARTAARSPSVPSALRDEIEFSFPGTPPGVFHATEPIRSGLDKTEAR